MVHKGKTFLITVDPASAAGDAPGSGGKLIKASFADGHIFCSQCLKTATGSCWSQTVYACSTSKSMCTDTCLLWRTQVHILHIRMALGTI